MSSKQIDEQESPPPTSSSAPIRLPLLAAALPSTGGPSRARVAYHEPRQAGKNACHPCRSKKIKCSGDRPVCTSCKNKGFICGYAAEPGERPAQANKRRLREIDDEMEGMKQKTENMVSLLEQRSRELVRIRSERDSLREQNLALTKSLMTKESRESIDRTPELRLLHLIKYAAESEVAMLIDLYRQGENPDKIAMAIQRNNTQIPMELPLEARLRFKFPYMTEMPTYLCVPGNTYLESTVYKATYQSALEASQGMNPNEKRIIYESAYVKPYHAAKLVDERLNEDISIQRWTRVKCSNETLLALLRVYFLYEHSQYTFFHKDLFLNDLATGEVRNSQHCSPLLVNAILTAACHCHSGFDNRARSFEDSRSLAFQFLAEARNLYDMKAGSYQATTVQAGFIMDLELSCQGKSTIGREYNEKGATMILEQRRLQSKRTPLDRANDDPSTKHARDFADWTGFAWQAIKASYFRSKPLIQHPPASTLPDPKIHHAWYSETWVHYPGDNTRTPSHFPYCLKARLELYTIINEIQWQRWAESPKGDLTLQQSWAFAEQLQDWFNDLPNTLKPNNIVWPAQLRVHLEYHLQMIQLFEAHIAPEKSTRSSRRNSDSSDDSERPISWQERQQCIDVVKASRLMLETVARLYYLRHSFQTHDALLLQVLAFLDGQVRRMQEEDQYRVSLGKRAVDDRTADFRLSTRFLCFRGLYDQAHSFHQAAFLFDWMVRNEITAAEFELCRRQTNMQADIEIDSREIKSEWVNPALRDGEDLSTGTMDALGKSYEDLDVRGRSEISRSRSLMDGVMVNGVDGVDGDDGVDGVDGVAGADGVDGVSEDEDEDDDGTDSDDMMET